MVSRLIPRSRATAAFGSPSAMRFFSSSSHRSGPFPAAICAALFGDDDAFALPFPDERALELGKGHDREHQIDPRGILADEGEAPSQEHAPDAASGKRMQTPNKNNKAADEA